MDGYCTNAGQRDDDRDVAEILCSLFYIYCILMMPPRLGCRNLFDKVSSRDGNGRVFLVMAGGEFVYFFVTSSHINTSMFFFFQS